MLKNQRKKAAATKPPPEIDVYQETLNAAAKLFRKQGYAATTLRQIGDAMGIQAGSIYYHFKSKEQILDKVLDAGIRVVLEEVRKRVDVLPADASCRERIEAAIEGHLVALLQHGDFTSANIRTYGQLPVGPRRRNGAIRAVYASYWDELLEDGRKRGELRGDINLAVLRPFVIGALNWTGEWIDPERGSLKKVIQQIASIVFDGIVSHEAARARGR